jgi:AraC-like DNA-binding protein
MHPSDESYEWFLDLLKNCRALARRVSACGRDEFPEALSAFAATLPVPRSPAEDVLLRDRVFSSAVAAGIDFHLRYHRVFKGDCPSSPVEGAAWLLEPLHKPRPEVPIREVIDRWTAEYLAVFDRHHRWPAASRAAGIIRKEAARPLTMVALARLTGASRAALIRDFRRFYGMSLREYRMRVRIRSILQELRAPGSNIDALARESGYRSAKSFYAAVRTLTGLTPAGIRGLSESELEALLRDGLHVPQGLAGTRRPERTNQR